MSSDSGELEPRETVAHELPKVIGFEVRRGAGRDRPQNFASALPETDATVELVVETDQPIPVRALGPVLYVGDTALIESIAEDPTHYRFLALQPEALDAGAPLSLGWCGRPEERRATGFRYQG